MKRFLLCFVFYAFLFLSCTSKLTLDNLKYTVYENVEKNNSGDDEYSIRYPEFEEYDVLNDEVQELVSYANSVITEFRKINADESLEENFFVFLDFDMLKVTNDYISVVFLVHTYFGGAHPNTELYTVNYNYKTDKIVNIEDILNSKNSNWLKLLSEYCIKTLDKRNQEDDDFSSDLDWIKSGAGENVENFSAFQVEKDGVVIFFQHYQVGPYSSGMPNVKVPFSIFKK